MGDEPKPGYYYRRYQHAGRTWTETRYVCRVATIQGRRVVEWTYPPADWRHWCSVAEWREWAVTATRD